MKKIAPLVVFLLFSIQGFAQTQTNDLPYPIIFVHGLNSDNSTWDEITNHLDDFFGATQIVNVVLNSDMGSTHYLNDVRIDFSYVAPLANGNIFTVNFNNWWNENPEDPQLLANPQHSYDGESQSNQSAIFKQGYALKLIIEKVLIATHSDGVVLVGHSMGGLAIREYLQRRDANGLPMWWVDNANTIDGHKVTRVFTLNTPHLGSNRFESIFPGLFNLRSEAHRDLRISYKGGEDGDYQGVYLFGGNEGMISDYSIFHNYDVNCDGDNSDNIIGISTGTTYNPILPLPSNIYYTWGTSTRDWIVSADKMLLYNQNMTPQPLGADTILTTDGHLEATENVRNIIRGLDEPNTKELAYDLTPKNMSFFKIDRTLKGFITYQAPSSILVDNDFYKVVLPAPGDISVSLSGTSSGIQQISVISGTSTVSNNNLPGDINIEVAAGTHFIRVRGFADDQTWQHPYTLKVKYDIGVPPQRPNNLSPVNGASLVHQNLTIEWSYVNTAKSYDFQLATDPSFSSLTYNQTGLTSSEYSVSNLELEKTYYWRVRSVNSWGLSEWSPVWSFTTEDAIGVGYINSTLAGGYWGNPDTWVDGKVPSENEDVVIRGPVTIGNDNYCKTLIIMGQGSIQSGTQSSSIIHLSGNLLNYGTIKDNQTGFSLYVWVAGNVTNLNEISAFSLVLNGSGNQFIGHGNENSFNCNISFSNSGGDLVAGSPLVFKKNVSLGGGKLQIGEYTTKITEGGTISGGEIVGRNLYYYSTALFRDMLFNVRNLFMRGMLFNCTFQGPVSFNDRIQISAQTIVNGDLTVQDTLECVDQVLSQHNNLYINGNLANNGIIFDRGGSFQNYLNISISGHLYNNGQMRNFGVNVAGNVANNKILSSYGLSLNGTGDQHLLLGSGKDFSIYNISFTNTTGSLIADSDLRFSGTVNLTTGKFVTGDYSVTGGYIIGGKIEQSAFRFYGDGTLRDMQINVRDLYMRGRLQNCTLQGPVTFHNRIMIEYSDTINGDLTVQDTLESEGHSGNYRSLQVNGKMLNNGIIMDQINNNSYLSIMITGDLTNNGEMRNSSYYLIGNSNRTIQIGDNCVSNFYSDGDSVILVGNNKLPNLNVNSGACVLAKNSELLFLGGSIHGNFHNYGKVVMGRPISSYPAVYDFFMSSVKLGTSIGLNNLVVTNFGNQVPSLFSSAVKNYWGVFPDPTVPVNSQSMTFSYKDGMLNGNEEDKLEIFHSGNGVTDWTKLSNPLNTTRNLAENFLRITDLPIQGYFAIASSVNFPSQVILTAPDNNRQNLNLPVLFKWQSDYLAERYLLSVAKDSLFTELVLADSTLSDTTKLLSNLENNVRYFWRVKAGNQTGWGDWSETWKFTTIIEKPTVPVLATPANDSKGLLNPITAKWNKSLRVEKYKLQVSTDNLFSSLIVNDSTLTDTTKLLPNLANYLQYYWRVKAVNVGGESDWSTVWSFKTLGNPYASNLLTPLDASVNQPLSGLTFKWTKAKDRIETIQKYQFQISSDSLFTLTIVNDSTLTDTIKVMNGMGYLTKYFWRVRAQNQTGWGDWSATWKFTTIIEKPTIPVLAAPSNNSNGLLNPITAKWNKSLRVEKYKLQVATDNLFNSIIVNDSTLTDTTKLLPNLANYTRYYWRVKAVNVGGESDWSTVWNFKTLGNPYATNLLTPLDASVNQPLSGLTFKWTKALERVETIQKYQFQISTDSLFGSFIINDSTLTDTSRIVDGLSYLTKHFWRVRAQNQTGWGDWSATWKFTTIIEKPTVPVLAAPLNNSNGLLNPISAKWNNSLRVEKYKLQVSVNNLFTSLILNDSTITDTTKLLPNLANYSQYYWRVKAVNIGGESDWSTVWNFKTLGNPYASNLITPLDASANHPLSGLLFKWTKALERIETIQKYQFQISTDSLFATTFINDTTLVDTSRIVGGMSYLTKYFWRVRAQNQTGWGDWSEALKFTTIIEKPTVPDLVTPLNDSKGLLNPITAKWNKSLRAEKYQLQVSTDNLFTSFIVNDSTLSDTTKLLPNLANYSQYYWRVKSVNIGGESDWSTVWNFKTLGNPYASNLITPLDASINQPLSGLTFKWTKATERIETIQKYQFQISTDSLFASTFVNDSTLTDTTKVVGGMGFSTKYFWRVRAQNQTGWGDWSNTWRFTTIIEKPSIPLLALPANGSKGLLNPITTKWNKSLRVEKYKLQVSSDNLFSSLIVNDSTLTDTNKLLPNLANYSQYYWRVKAVNVGGESDWSTVWNFKTLGNPYASNLLTPLDASVNQPLNGLTFKWSKAQERIETIQKYQLQISSDSLFGSFFINDTTLTDTSRIVNGMGYLTKYFWRVRAQNQTGWGDWSETWKFTTIIEKPTIPVLATPLNDSKGLLNPITGMWNKSLRVEKYKFQVSSNNLFTSFIVNDSTLTDTTKILPNLANYSQYYWRVKAVNVGGESDWSMVWNFKTLGNPYASNLIEPQNSSVNHPLNGLTFKWTKATERIETIQKYQIQISTDSLFASTFVNDSTLTDTSKVVDGMDYLTEYFWRVRAQNQTGWGDWSATWKFTTIIEKPTIPVLATPLNDSKGLLNPITATWNKSLRVEKYKLQVATDNLFSSLIVNDSTLTDTTKLMPNLANYTQYYWRVKASNIGGESDWSTVWNFKTLGNPYSVILASPENGTVNNPVNSVTFKWYKPQERIETILKYHFQLSTDSLFGSIAFSDSTFILDTTTTGSGLSYLTTYFWRVRAKNETGWGDWSQFWNLTTIIDKPSVPLLVSPANNVTQLLQPVVLRWRQSLRVEKYTLEISESPNFTTLFLVDSTLTDTMRTLPQLENAKTWYWRVKARNIGGSSEYSAVWNFRTLGLPLTVNLITPSNGSENLPVNDVLLQWSNSGEQTLGSVTSAAKSIKRAINDEESVGLTDGISTLEGGNHFASGNANPSSGVASIGNYWLEITTDTSNSALFYSDSTLTDTTKLMSGFVYQSTYFWRVKANNEVGWGSFSRWFRFTTQKKPIATPTALTATATVVKQVTLSWADNSDNELGFIILRKTGDSTSTALLERIDSVGADVTEFIDTTVTDTTYYSYKVMAYNADTLSEQSNYATVFTLTGIKEISSDIPKEFSLYQNYPNPFNPSTIIRFALPKDAHVEIELYSIQGELLNKLVSEDKQAGYYEVSLEIPSYASGIYFYRIVASPGDRGEPFVQTRKFILMK